MTRLSICEDYTGCWLNIPAYTCENRILNISDAVHRIRLLYKLRSSYRDRSIQNTVKRLRRSVLQKKKKKLNKKWNQEPGHFDKLFVKNTRKTRRAGKHFGVFSLTLKATFLIHYSPVLLTYTPLKHPKTFRFLHVHQAFERSLGF